MNTTKKSLEECCKCVHLSQYRKENNYKIVWSDGNPAANIMLIGEAPGEQEAKAGKPFVGRAGKKLRGILEDFVDVKEDVFITNTVLCRPPNNRKPLPNEQKNCFQHIESMFFVVKPKLVITAGRTSSDWMATLTKTEYEIYHHQEVQWGELFFGWLPVYHPSYLLRKPAATQPFIDALQRYYKILYALRKNAL